MYSLSEVFKSFVKKGKTNFSTCSNRALNSSAVSAVSEITLLYSSSDTAENPKSSSPYSARGELARTNPEAAIAKYAVGREHYVVTESPIKKVFVKPLVKDWKDKLLK